MKQVEVNEIRLNLSLVSWRGTLWSVTRGTANRGEAHRAPSSPRYRTRGVIAISIYHIGVVCRGRGTHASHHWRIHPSFTTIVQQVHCLWWKSTWKISLFIFSPSNVLLRLIPDRSFFNAWLKLQRQNWRLIQTSSSENLFGGKVMFGKNWSCVVDPFACFLVSLCNYILRLIRIFLN